MKSILVVEDSAIVMKVLRHVLARSSLIHPVYASSLHEAKALVESGDYAFFAALVDLTLPDAPNGEVVDYTLALKLPTVVLTGSFDAERREVLLAKGIVDYVTKEGRFSYQYALGVLHRLIKNQTIKVLIVDDSSTQRNFIVNLLRLHLYQVVEASDGVDAIKALLAHPDIKVLITDYNMPRMDGCELVKTIRAKYEKTDLIIIGLSSDSESALSARFIKNGANDFLRKPFNHEEFFCRISHNVEFVELIEQVRDTANRDELTGCYNRKYFFEQGANFRDRAVQKGGPLSVVVIDLDRFKQINDKYGHEIGNFVMQRVAEGLRKTFDRFLLARAGGAEFFALLPGLPNEKAVEFVDRVRELIAADRQIVGQDETSISFSAGVTSLLGESIDDMLYSAGLCLHRAKDAGGDLVFGDDDSDL
ncbi:diguanylate cyclase [Teredinibacter franksiae]|uniref:diguanylate cyclase n=1 Tax=Teredinibacter franksiae TaxID=2761453 RepID=UPI001626D562|nr:diguanylate cyclase [Teredinibacter franksiae]